MVGRTPPSINIKKEGGQNTPLYKHQDRGRAEHPPLKIARKRGAPPSINIKKGECGAPPLRIGKKEGEQSTPLYKYQERGWTEGGQSPPLKIARKRGAPPLYKYQEKGVRDTPLENYQERGWAEHPPL